MRPPYLIVYTKRYKLSHYYIWFASSLYIFASSFIEDKEYRKQRTIKQQEIWNWNTTFASTSAWLHTWLRSGSTISAKRVSWWRKALSILFAFNEWIMIRWYFVALLWLCAIYFLLISRFVLQKTGKIGYFCRFYAKKDNISYFCCNFAADITLL